MGVNDNVKSLYGYDQQKQEEEEKKKSWFEILLQYMKEQKDRDRQKMGGVV